MSGLSTQYPWILAQAAAKVAAPGTAKAAPAAAPQAEPNPLIQLLPFLPVLVVWYFLMIRPQQKQERVRRAMLGALKKNDRVLTSAGIYGTVVSVDTEQDRVVLRVDDEKGLRLTVSRASIGRVLTPTDRDKDKSTAGAAASS